ncbi:MAG: hypothetical protein Ct9H300mP14_11570 [Gammaproteobacteria bacterium]|nr:MAG: hypothetical protein Ct9H300mP14_11570 [Gammaproteobacteria bacterium]
MDKFADAIGLAYQVIDDVLDGTVSTDVLGKDSGSDRNADKSTYLTELGEQKRTRVCAESARASDQFTGQLIDEHQFAQETRWIYYLPNALIPITLAQAKHRP